MVSTHPLISMSSSPYVDCTKSTNYNWYHRHLHVPQFFPFPSKVEALIFLFTSFQYYAMVSRDSKVHNSASSLSFVNISYGGLAEIWISVCISKPRWSLCISFSWTDAGLCIYHSFVSSNLNFLHSSKWITFPAKSCLVLHSFCANLLLITNTNYVIERFISITYIYFVASYLYLRWKFWFLVRYFVLLLDEIKFLS